MKLASFTLIGDWKAVVLKAHSLRWTLVAGAFGAMEIALPAFQDSIARGWFAGASLLACVGSMLSRIKAQPEMHE